MTIPTYIFLTMNVQLELGFYSYSSWAAFARKLAESLFLAPRWRILELSLTEPLARILLCVPWTFSFGRLALTRRIDASFWYRLHCARAFLLLARNGWKCDQRLAFFLANIEIRQTKSAHLLFSAHLNMFSFLGQIRRSPKTLYQNWIWTWQSFANCFGILQI